VTGGHLDVRIAVWNVHQGNTGGNVRAALDTFAQRDARVIFLSEAYGQHPTLSTWARQHGWTLIHHQGTILDGVETEDADCALLIAPGIQVKRRRVLAMTRRWWVNGQHRHPRRYPTATIRLGKRWGKVSAGHWPLPHGGPAWRETRRKITRWFRSTLPRRWALHGADINAVAAQLDQWVMTLPGHREGERVDHAIGFRCHPVDMVKLPPFGSDHECSLLITMRIPGA
jgi:hypothetical protein